jgi:hypothetical protein
MTTFQAVFPLTRYTASTPVLMTDMELETALLQSMFEALDALDEVMAAYSPEMNGAHLLLMWEALPIAHLEEC